VADRAQISARECILAGHSVRELTIQGRAIVEGHLVAQRQQDSFALFDGAPPAISVRTAGEKVGVS
jgi:hypothetical protein